MCVQGFAAPRPRCRLCALPLPGQARECGQCLKAPPPFAAAVAAVDYAFPWNGLIASLKFHGSVEHAGALARLLADAVHHSLIAGNALAPDLIVPVPLAPARLRQRGHNQAWELARRMARLWRLPAQADALARWQDTAPQLSLTRAQRLSNLRGAFVVTPKGRPCIAGRRVALVDDVMTTGATATEAALTLRRGGASEVQVWVLARASGG
ncbi:MAG TPA: ComF family protein [Burkholderiaceae bacterium]|nr:ComF family protein [Burkholderiaceae bacterium]